MDLLAVPRSDRSTSSSPRSSFSADTQAVCTSLSDHRHPPHATQRQDPAVVAETAIAVQIERQRVAEALAARDNVVGRLEYACASVHQKTATISRLQQELEELRRSSTPCIISTPAASPGVDAGLCSESGKHVRETLWVLIGDSSIPSVERLY